MPRSRESTWLPWLAWLFASLATAALTHALIGALSVASADDDAYADHAHTAVAPIVLASAGLLVSLLLGSALRRVSRSQAIDPCMVLARRFGTMPLLLPTVRVSLGGFAVLLGMEFTEQIAAFGHIKGVDDALGGNIPLGLTLVCLAAGAITIVGLRSARALVAGTSAVVCAFVAWIVVNGATLVDDAAIRHSLRRRTRASPMTVLARCCGLRAPPLRLL